MTRDDDRLLVERTGGFGGITMAASIDTSTLSPEQRSAVEGFLRGQAATAEYAAPDRFVYRFELGSRQAVVPEDRLPDSLRPLLRRLSPRFNQAGS